MNKKDIEQPRINHSLEKKWIKFLLSCFIFLLSFKYVTDQLKFGELFPLNYFQSTHYSQQVEQFLEAFYQTEIILPTLQTPLEGIEVSQEEILDAKYNSSDYNHYLYDPTTGEDLSITTLTDEEIEDLIRYDKYQRNQSDLQYYENSSYLQNNAFYYDLIDSNGNHYINIDSNTTDYLNIIEIPYKGPNSSNFNWLNNYAQSIGISGTLYLPKYSMGNSTIQKEFTQHILSKFLCIGAIVLSLTLIIPIYRDYKAIKDTRIKLPLQYQWMEKKYLDLPIEIKGLIFLITSYFIYRIYLNTYYYLYYGNLLIYAIKLLIQALIMLILLYYFILQIQGILYRIKHPEQLLKEWHNGFYMNNIEDWQTLPIYKNTFLRITGYSCMIGLWGVIWGISFHDYGTFTFITLISIIIGTFLLTLIKKKSKQIQKIVTTLSKMANNEITSEIHVKRNGLINAIAKDINKIREGLAVSNQKQSNSERLKTELITNVSHDLRTPLTSILNYVDLAKRDDITEEERQEYLQIIDNKSKRLKILIDDLFEASKMASGAVELHKEQVDLVSLMYQALAEYEDQFEEKNLSIRTKTSHQHIYAYCDGRKLYRVFENLLNNVIKYAQPTTRVYLEIITEDTEVVITLKNISNYELGFDISELAERFKRGDSSRHTEGSGLGLSIVKSILDLHKADLELSQDGDLFKVIIRIKKMQKSIS